MDQYVTVSTDVATAARYLTAGRVVAFPTGTAYGLAVDALQGHALQRLRNLKGRPAAKTFTVFMRPAQWDTYLKLRDEERRVLTAAVGQPLTLLVKPQAAVAYLALEDRIGVRVIDHPLMQRLADAVDVPLTATSANYAGNQPCYTVSCILKEFLHLLPDDRLGEDDPSGASGTTYDLSLAMIFNGGPLPERPPTTVAKIEGGQVTVVRPGTLTATDLLGYAASEGRFLKTP